MIQTYNTIPAYLSALSLDVSQLLIYWVTTSEHGKVCGWWLSSPTANNKCRAEASFAGASRAPGRCNEAAGLPLLDVPHGLPSGKHTNNYGKSPFLMGKSYINWPFSIATLVYRRVSVTMAHYGLLWCFLIFQVCTASKPFSRRSLLLALSLLPSQGIQKSNMAMGD